MPNQPPQLQALVAAVAGLSYPSESDEPFEVFHWPAGSQVSARQALATHVAPGRRIDRVSLDQFFSQLAGSDQARGFDQLRQVLESQLSGAEIYRVGNGEVCVDFYILGRGPNGTWLGLHTVSVET